MSYLKRLLECLKSIFHLNSTKPEPYESIHESELVSRFIFSSSHYSSTKKVVKYPAFIPSSAGEASILRIDNLSEEQIQKIDAEFISGRRGKKSLARAEVFISDIYKVGLIVSADIENTHPRHANIKGFASEKSFQKQQALELANKSHLVLYDS
jgi:hypothetical protein